MTYDTEVNWDLWYHSITDNNWGKSSYKKLSSLSNLFDYKYFKENFRQDHFQNGMFFYMKENIFPNWEDPDNRNGSCLSFKVFSKDIMKEWNTNLSVIDGNQSYLILERTHYPNTYVQLVVVQ